MEANQRRFQERLSRIHTGNQFVPDGVIVGRHGKAVMSKDVRRIIRRPRLGLRAMLMALLIGIAALVAVRIARFHLYGSGAPDTAILTDYLLFDLAGALCLSWIARMMLRLRGTAPMLAGVAGAVVAAQGMHMAVHRNADAFVWLFSGDWVARVLSTTDPNVVLFNPF